MLIHTKCTDIFWLGLIWLNRSCLFITLSSFSSTSHILFSQSQIVVFGIKLILKFFVILKNILGWIAYYIALFKCSVTLLKIVLYQTINHNVFMIKKLNHFFYIRKSNQICMISSRITSSQQIWKKPLNRYNKWPLKKMVNINFYDYWNC